MKTYVDESSAILMIRYRFKCSPRKTNPQKCKIFLIIPAHLSSFKLLLTTLFLSPIILSPTLLLSSFHSFISPAAPPLQVYNIFVKGWR
ncbi:hypothetical protein MKW98_029930 [Papaver atlanticum]|uniref:Uncharacterized protein n=1 Tax=Papaver atlanticum TaxID=357466 RepID=A0AAD4XZ09_9MAGN|nr:hypothetical protein MKW98_029930 [Papaver atlanticum]